MSSLFTVQLQKIFSLFNEKNKPILSKAEKFAVDERDFRLFRYVI